MMKQVKSETMYAVRSLGLKGDLPPTFEKDKNREAEKLRKQTMKEKLQD